MGNNLSGSAETYPTIDQLWVYPVKSCAGIQLPSSLCTTEGLEHDRQWMIVETKTMKACTARQFPKMLQLTPTIGADNLLLALPSSSEPPISLPLALPQPSWELLDDLKLWTLTLTGISPPASHEANVQLSAFFGRDVRIVRKAGKLRGPGKKGPREGRAAFADTYPLHVLTLPSAEAVCASMQHDAEPVTPESLLRRLRPNIVVRLPPGTEDQAFSEDHWSVVRVLSGSQSEPEEAGGFEVVGRCGRCTLPNIDPSTSARHTANQPHRILTVTRPKEVDEFVGVPCPVLGVYAVPLELKEKENSGKEREMRWSVGDEVRIESWVRRD